VSNDGLPTGSASERLVRAIREDLPSLCFVCGYDYQSMPADDWPWGPDGVDPTFNFCDCCGVEFGYQDATLSACRQSRRRWIEAGTTWADTAMSPLREE